MPCLAVQLPCRSITPHPAGGWLHVISCAVPCCAVLCRVVSCSFSAAENDLNSLLLAGCMDGSVHLLHAGDNQGVFRSCVDPWKQ
jgi:hypothetical protein